jgi:hypothetical protein
MLNGRPARQVQFMLGGTAIIALEEGLSESIAFSRGNCTRDYREHFFSANLAGGKRGPASAIARGNEQFITRP